MYKALFFLLTFVMAFEAQAGDGILRKLTVNKLLSTAFVDAGYRPKDIQISESEAFDSLIMRAVNATGLPAALADKCADQFEQKEVHFKYQNETHNCIISYHITTGNGLLEHLASISMQRCNTDTATEMAKQMKINFIFTGDTTGYSTNIRKITRGQDYYTEMCKNNEEEED